jgi:hypothetical protein
MSKSSYCEQGRGISVSKAKISRLNPTACVGRRGRALFVDMVFTRTFIVRENETEKAKSFLSYFGNFWITLTTQCHPLIRWGR